MSDAPEVRENDAEHRFEIWVDDELAGVLVHDGIGPVVSLLHTKIDDRFGGRGLGSVLIRTVLDAIRARGLMVMPYCPFVKAFIQKHPEYVALVPETERTAFGLPLTATP